MWMRIVAEILIVLNLVGFLVVWIDKLKARKGRWRISERVIFYICAFGGTPGVYTGLWVFRHKTRKWYFVFGIPLIFLIQICVIYIYCLI